MDSASAARFLHPQNFCIATAAATASLGDFGSGAFPTFYSLITGRVKGDLNNVAKNHFPGSLSYQRLLQVLSTISFTTDVSLTYHFAIPVDISSTNNVKQVLDKIMQAIVLCPETLHQAIKLMEPQSDPEMHGAYEPDGVISRFIRKAVVSFYSLSFEAHSRLVHDLRAYMMNAKNIFEYSPRTILPKCESIRATAFDLVKGRIVSQHKFQQLGQMFQLSRQPTTATNAAIQRLPGLTVGVLPDMTLPSSEYATNIEAQRRRNFSAAVDSMHRYFDLALVEIGRHKEPTEEEKDIHGHQYAAMALGVMHTQLGNLSLASTAFEDTLRAAQQCSDEPCQAHALSWLANIETNTARKHRLLQHSGNRLALAREEVNSVFTPGTSGSTDELRVGVGEDPEAIGEHEGSTRMQRILGKLQFIHLKEQIEGLLISAAAWESHGAISTALSIARVALHISKRIHEDRCCTSTARATIAVASLSAANGNFAQAEHMLEYEIKRLQSQNHDSKDDIRPTVMPEVELLTRSLLWLQFERAVRRLEVHRAEEMYNNIAAHAKCISGDGGPFTKDDLVLDSIEAKCKWQMVVNNPKEAAQEAELMCHHAAGFGRPSRVIEALRLRAESFLLAASYNSALLIALAAVSLSRGLGLEASHVRSVLTLTDIMLHMNQVQPSMSSVQALDALLPILPQALEGMDIQTCARAYKLHAECLLACCHEKGEQPDNSFTELIELAMKSYEKCDDVLGLRDCAYILSRFYNWRKNYNERNKAAREFNKYQKLISERGCLTSVGKT